jgi:hypothetical protein
MACGVQRQLASGASARSAASQPGGPLHSTASAHFAALATIRGGDARGLMYQTSNSQYGARASLEQVGPSRTHTHCSSAAAQQPQACLCRQRTADAG